MTSEDLLILRKKTRDLGDPKFGKTPGKTNNHTPRLLAKKTVIIIEPEDLLGTVVWPI
jgi:hypothetical protein